MRLIVSGGGADFDTLAVMLAAGILHSGAELVLPRSMHWKARRFLEHNQGLLDFKDIDPLEEDVLDDVLVAGEDHEDFLTALRQRAARVTVYSRAASMVLQLKSRDAALTPSQATLLALGIYRETRCLTYSIGSADFEALAFLFDRGAEREEIATYMGGENRDFYQLLFEKIVGNYRVRSIEGYRVLFCQGEAGDYLEGFTDLIPVILRVAQAQLALLVFPFHGNNYVNAITLAGTGLNLHKLLDPYRAEGGPLRVSFFLEGEPGVIMQEMEAQLYKNLLPGITAKDIMDGYVKTLSPDDSLSYAKGQLEKRGVLSLPVAAEKGYRGIISLGQINKAMAFGHEESTVEDLMDPSLDTASPGTPLKELVKQLALKDRDMIPVVDHTGHLQGVVTYVETLRALYREKNPLFERPTAITASPEEGVERLVVEKVPRYIQGVLQLLGRTADAMEVPVYAVGGFVRDLILGIQSDDLDVVVEGDALALARKVKELLGGKLTENREFGTASISTSRQTIDFSTARQEFYALPASLPEVERASLRKDLFRRDFTINTLAFQLNLKEYGRFFDFYGGLKDLENRSLRVLYNLSFVDDPLRILRALRFSVRLGFQISPETKSLIKRAQKSRALKKVSRERLTRELELSFREKKIALIIKGMEELGVLAQIIPQISLREKNYTLIRELEQLVLQQEPPVQDEINLFLLYLAGLLYGDITTDLFSRLHGIRLSRQHMETLTEILNRGVDASTRLKEEGLPPREVYDIFNGMAPETCIFALALAEGSCARTYYEQYSRELCHLTPALTGNELIQMGMEPGPLFQDILYKLKMERIEGRVTSVEDELSFIQKYFQSPRPPREKGFDT